MTAHKRKKSLVGWTWKEWYLIYERDNVMNVPLLIHTKISNTSRNCPFKKDSKVKVKVTIEEII